MYCLFLHFSDTTSCKKPSVKKLSEHLRSSKVLLWLIKKKKTMYSEAFFQYIHYASNNDAILRNILSWKLFKYYFCWVTKYTADLFQGSGCSVGSEGSGLSLLCVGSPCCCSVCAESHLSLRTSPQNPPAAERKPGW